MLQQSLTLQHQRVLDAHRENVRRTAVKDRAALDLRLPTDDEVLECTTRTRAALQLIIDAKVAAKSTAGHIGPGAAVSETFVKYTPASHTDTNAQQRIIKIVEAPVDPMLPPKFKNNQKTPAVPDTQLAGAAVLKGQPVHTDKKQPLSAEDQKAWYIPPAISNWKNPKGFTIAIDKRMAAFGSGEKDNSINDNFAKLAASLHQADRNARNEIKARSRLKIKQAEKKKQENEEKLRQLALRARESRYGRSTRNENDKISDYNESVRQREQDRRARVADYEKSLRYDKLSQDKKLLSLASETDPSNPSLNSRATSNLAVAPANPEDTLLDARLFSNASRFSLGGADSQVYSTPLFNYHEGIQNIYTVSNKGAGEEADAADHLGSLAKRNRFKVLSGGADRDKVAERSGAVMFTKAGSEKNNYNEDDTNGEEQGGRESGANAGDKRRYGFDSDEKQSVKKSRWDDEDDE